MNRSDESHEQAGCKGPRLDRCMQICNDYDLQFATLSKPPPRIHTNTTTAAAVTATAVASTIANIANTTAADATTTTTTKKKESIRTSNDK